MKGGAAISYNTAPCGLETMPGPDPTWAKIEDTATLFAHVVLACQLLFCLSRSVSHFWSVHLPIFVRRSFFSIFCPLFSSSFVCRVCAPPVSYYSNPIYVGDKHMHTHCLSIRDFFLSAYLMLLSLFFLNSRETRQCSKLPKFSCRKQFILAYKLGGLKVSLAIAQTVNIETAWVLYVNTVLWSDLGSVVPLLSFCSEEIYRSPRRDSSERLTNHFDVL